MYNISVLRVILLQKFEFTNKNIHGDRNVYFFIQEKIIVKQALSPNRFVKTRLIHTKLDYSRTITHFRILKLFKKYID